MFYTTTVCAGFFPLGSVSRAMQLHINQHKITVSDKYVLIFISSIAVYNAPPFLIIFSPSSTLSASVSWVYYNWLNSLSFYQGEATSK